MILLFPLDPNSTFTVDTTIYRSGTSWLYVVPFGIRRLANWVKQQYGDVPIYFTENGVSDNTGTLEDYARIRYLRSYTNEVLKGKS